MEKRTPLYERHCQQGGKIVPFAGYELPVQYPTGVIAEHMAVRTKAGMFDVSHMGELVFSGSDALANINRLLTNDFTGMAVGRVRYSPMCYDNGTTVDDLIVYKFSETDYLAVVNAANKDKDAQWMRQHLEGDVTLRDISDEIGQIALQGPASLDIMRKISDPEKLPSKYYSFTRSVEVAGVECLVSTTGYTGESGFEIYAKAQEIARVWDALLECGAEYGLIPCGLGSRDTLRLEAGMPLYGHELSDTIDPLESGLAFAVKMNKADFTGKQGLIERSPSPRTRVGLKITGRGIARENCRVYLGETDVGCTTSGTFLPYLGGAYAMAFVEVSHSDAGTQLTVDVRGRMVEAEIVPLPFYKR